ncbi:MAG: hypothetical protein JW704_02295 [Anaerolineaceae bacterium]|nr:hypothetical protein [Anaerolineaceae bacterium]MBN2676831.1 hypothetical protein [Anaerolineaceae bacterium]
MTDKTTKSDTDNEIVKEQSGKQIARPDASDPVKSEQICPHCQRGHLEYDGCLNLTCPECGFIQSGGGFT